MSIASLSFSTGSPGGGGR